MIAALICVLASGLACPGLLSNASALERDGVSMADSTEVGGKKLVLNGIGSREATIFHVKVYLAGLYVEKPSHDPDVIIGSHGPKKVVLTFVRDVGADKIKDAWAEGFERNSPGDTAALRPGLTQLQSLMRDIKKGQSLTFNIDDKQVEVLIDGTSAGTIAGGALFSKTLLSAWIVKPPNDSLKTGMLGLTN